ncbi:hypothetical protein WAZ07_05935 [Bacillus sp. FJAT-51639]|uniref:TetR family transcriptional regulator n=2 Tax=Bacillus TaxID=1386 RepID=A0ABU8FGN1_9BACI
MERGTLVINALIERGVLPKDDSQVITGIIQALMMLLHKDEIGEELFPKVIDKLIEYVSEGLTNKK